MSVSCHCWVLRIHLQIRCSTSVHINIIINNLIDLIGCLVDMDLRFNVHFSNHGPYFHDGMDLTLLICTLRYWHGPYVGGMVPTLSAWSLRFDIVPALFTWALCCWHDPCLVVDMGPILFTWSLRCWYVPTLLAWSLRCWHDPTLLTWPYVVDMTLRCWHGL